MEEIIPKFKSVDDRRQTLGGELTRKYSQLRSDCARLDEDKSALDHYYQNVKDVEKEIAPTRNELAYKKREYLELLDTIYRPATPEDTIKITHPISRAEIAHKKDADGNDLAKEKPLKDYISMMEIYLAPREQNIAAWKANIEAQQQQIALTLQQIDRVRPTIQELEKIDRELRPEINAALPTVLPRLEKWLTSQSEEEQGNAMRGMGAIEEYNKQYADLAAIKTDVEGWVATLNEMMRKAIEITQSENEEKH
jgi:hypothetical protein